MKTAVVALYLAFALSLPAQVIQRTFVRVEPAIRSEVLNPNRGSCQALRPQPGSYVVPAICLMAPEYITEYTCSSKDAVMQITESGERICVTYVTVEHRP